MNTNQKIRRIGGIVVLLILCGMLLPVFCKNSRAAEVTHYYVYLDDARYEVTKDEYARIYGSQSDTDVLVSILREILGERMPASFSVVSGEVTTENSDSTYDNSDFLIENGRLISYRGSDTTVTVPNTVTVVSSLAFYNNSKVKKIILPSSVTTVEKYAFAKCSSLRVISFPKETVTLIDNILYDCGKILNFAAPKLSKAYSYAEKKGIAVTTTNKIKFASSHIYLLAGDTDTIPLLNCINTVTYKSKKKSVVSVTKSGKIRAKKKGTTIIQASAGGKNISTK